LAKPLMLQRKKIETAVTGFGLKPL
jgi:hypothetical protein